MVTLNVDTDAVVIFTNKLEKLNRSAFPVAVRTALNSAAFDVKMSQLQRSADKNFKKRQPNFFKANSRVEKATGWYLDEMQAKVGMIDLGGNNYAVDDLEQQEEGGKIGGKTLIPIDQKIHAGTKKVSKMDRVGAIRRGNKIITRAVSGKTEGQRFSRAVKMVGVGGIIVSKYKGKKLIVRVNSLNKIGRFKHKLTFLYTVKSGRKVEVTATHFMKEAATSSAMHMDRFFIEAAEREFEKALR
jgi:hypothetical protein